MWPLYLSGMLCVFALCYVTYDTVQRMLTATGPDNGGWWNRATHAFHDSATMFVARAGTFLSALIGAIAAYGDIFQSEAVKAVVGQYLPPNVMTLVMMLFSVSTEIARKRTL